MADLKFHKVVETGEAVHTEILNHIVFKSKLGTYYFIEESVFRKNLQNLLKSDESVPLALTKWIANESDYLKVLEQKRIVLDDYYMPDPDTPDNIIPGIF